MQTKNLTPFVFGAKVTSLQPPQRQMTMIVRASFKLRPGEPLTPIEGMVERGSLTGDLFAEGDDDRAGECLYASDFADFKLHAEVLLAGACHVPGARPALECPVRFSVGAWSKTLHVVGRRVWTQRVLGAAISEPEPFVTMPLTYANAFGGPAHPLNPVGKGRDTPDLPTVEQPGVRVHGKGDLPEPASFGPLNAAWLQRARKIGKEYGPKWKKERAPFFSEDFDWTYFNAAPADQQLPGYLQGDEELSFVNLHPDAPMFSAKLPGLRIRAFAKDAEGTLREAPMQLDTLVADLNEERLLLTWRGLVPVREDDLDDVKTVLIASENLADPMQPEAHYRAILEKFEADPLDRAELAASMGGLAAVAKDDAAHPERTPAERGQAILQHDDALVASAPAAQQDALRRAFAATRAKLAATPTAAPPARPADAPSPAELVAAAVARVDKAVKTLRSQGAPSAQVEQLERLLEDPRTKKRIASITPPRPEEIGPGKDLSGRPLTKMNLEGIDLSGANLEGANLIGARLKGARLAGANLRRAVLTGADLEGADLSGADLTQATLTRVHACGADLRRTLLDQTVLDQADLQGATLAEARGLMTMLTRANLTGANLRGCDFWKAIANDSTFAKADLTEAKLRQCLFTGAKAEGVTLTRAIIDNTTFAGSELRGASADRVQGEGTNWGGAVLEGADFRFAVLPSAHFAKADVRGASFFGADLRNVELYRAAVDGADFEKANLFGADLGKATMSGTRFVHANLYEASFLGAGGKGADLRGANVKRAILPS
jgi:uncharacterized protein YjbI with pentapeptide repeats